MSTGPGELAVHPATPERWNDLERLFGPNGAIAGCWCMWWRLSGREWDELGRDGRREGLRDLVDDGRVPGLLGYRDGEPAGWVSVAPRAEFGRILRSPVLGRVDGGEEPVWSVVCFYIPAGQRRGGIGRVLLEAAVAHARERGARTLEAYPIDVGAADRRPASNELFTGVLSMYREAGFEEVDRRSPTRPVVRVRTRT